MSYSKNEDGSITISATLRADEWPGFLLAWGYMQANAELFDPPALWLLLSVLNRFMEGNPDFTPYEIPADRRQPFKYQHLQIEELPEPPKQ